MDEATKIFSKAVQEIYNSKKQYSKEAYFFIRAALDFTVKATHKNKERAHFHVTTKELLEGIRTFALDQYGPMALTVLNTWGVERCRDFGQIVFNLIEKKIFSKTDGDKLEDFDDGYSFDEAFAKPFLPSVPHKKTKNLKPLPEMAPELASLN